MWSRQDLKERAKNILKVNYWQSFVISLAMMFVSGAINFSFNLGSSSGNSGSSLFSGDVEFGAIIAIIVIFLVAFAIGLVISFAYNAFVSGPLTLGVRKFFVQSAYGETNLDYIAHGFKNNYLSNVKTIFLKNLFIGLWSMLFVIPGIIKYYEYYMVEYIVAENPNIDYKRAFEISKTATEGQKWEMFVFDLSFIGWYLLGTLACCIGVIFVNPYVLASQAQLYLALKEHALRHSFATDADFGHYNNYQQY